MEKCIQAVAWLTSLVPMTSDDVYLVVDHKIYHVCYISEYTCSNFVLWVFIATLFYGGIDFFHRSENLEVLKLQNIHCPRR